MKKILAAIVTLSLISPVAAAAQLVTTPYWCGWGWSSTPCAGYAVQQYGYPYSYPYSYSPSYSNYPCAPISYDSRGMVVQTTCGYVGGAYPQNQYWYQPYHQSYYQSYYPQYQYRDDRHGNWDGRHHDWDHY